ncbi:beta-ketoacyl synthase N-terminal-like domain-containing protein [Marivirga harenae]|uniref:thiolase C-terminal domain-containing protein n=1 Tax=Marivirga harenae TaxID=2010992 RepID=UPI0026DF2600|nr:beta-ketoacyl synthase N-terminal-like domain-containing protein [Marivirga harenae]WKV13204.1 beta-ketoacyl synthase N-terminal-like domain-containing protein [Marivirga harenae]|tara:strand:+ start:8615 stop:9799 length:1185 start_codon:yes stop_codon:yes gene_type:complete
MDLGVNITGAYHSSFGKLEGETLYSLYEKAAKGAIKDAQIETKAIDGVFVGNYSGGAFNQQENIASYGVNVLPALRHKPMYRTETACSSGSSAIHMGIMAIKSGMMKRVLVVGIEKMTDLDMSGVTKALSLATFWPDEGSQSVTAPCMFADLAKGWMKKYNYSEEKLRPWLAQISAKAYSNGAENPLAQLQKPKSADDILALPDEKNPIINAPLRLHDCSLVSDGASALVLEEASVSKGKGLAIKSFYSASDYLDSFGKHKSDHFLEGASFAVKKALKDANFSIEDIDIAEVHDCFTITELLLYSAMGIAPAGREFEAIESGKVFPDGDLPVNLSGGLKAKGHPIGATGVSMHAYLYKQLVQEAWGHQAKNAQTALVVNIGGSGTSNAVSVLGR